MSWTLRACDSSIPIFVFTNLVCRSSLDSTSADYYNVSSYIQLGPSFFAYCASCGSRNEYGRIIRGSNVTMLIAGLYNMEYQFIRTSTHKFINFQLDLEIYYSVAIAAIEFGLSKCSTLSEQVYPSKSAYFCWSKARMLVPTEFDSIGAQEFCRYLTPMMLNTSFLMCSNSTCFAHS